MRLNNKFWLFAIICMAFTAAIAVTLAVLFWRQINPAEQQLWQRKTAGHWRKLRDLLMVKSHAGLIRNLQCMSRLASMITVWAFAPVTMSAMADQWPRAIAGSGDRTD